MPPDTTSKPAKPKRRTPITSEAALQSIALRYVSRFPCTTHKLRQHLGNKLREAALAGDAPHNVSERWLVAVIATLTRIRVLDDDAYAEGRANTLHRRGRAASIISRDLARAGAPKTSIDRARELLAEATPNVDLSAAILLAKRKRLGPYSVAPITPELRRRQLAMLARAGFSYDVAKRVLDAASPEHFEA